MRIERKVMTSVLFKDIVRGDVFIDNDGNICMKTECLFISNEVKSNAATLDSGDLFFVEDNNFVWLPKSVKLIVED